MKKTIALILTMLLCVCLAPTALAGAESAVRSAQNFTVDGKNIDCEKYNIDGSNYFKLRDLAYLLSGTDKQFAVGFDAASGTVSIETGKGYTAVGGELVTGTDKASTVVPSAQTILIDGKEVTTLTVYNIGGNNYFKLRDLGNYVGFGVDYDASTNTAIVTTGGRILWLCTKASTGGIEYEYTYDANGNMLSETITYKYRSKNNIDKTVYTYNEKGNKLTEDFTSAYGNSSIVYTYDEKGRLCSEEENYSGYTYSTVYTYDENGNMLTAKCTDNKGKIETIAWTYAANGNRLTEKCTDSNGRSKTTVWTYDTNGNILSKECNLDAKYDDESRYDRIYNPSPARSDPLTTVWTYTYDVNGNMLTCKSTDSDGLETSTVCTYDANGNMLTKEYRMPGLGGGSTTTYEYISITV